MQLLVATELDAGDNRWCQAHLFCTACCLHQLLGPFSFLELLGDNLYMKMRNMKMRTYSLSSGAHNFHIISRYVHGEVETMTPANTDTQILETEDTCSAIPGNAQSAAVRRYIQLIAESNEDSEALDRPVTEKAATAIAEPTGATTGATTGDATAPGASGMLTTFTHLPDIFLTGL